MTVGVDQEQRKAAQPAMEEWREHPRELGKKPCKIEVAGEFDLHELHSPYRISYGSGCIMVRTVSAVIPAVCGTEASHYEEQRRGGGRRFPENPFPLNRVCGGGGPDVGVSIRQMDIWG